MTTALARWRVPLGFICGFAVLVLARPTLRSLMVGGTIAIAGELVRIWAAGHLEKGREVTRSGPYRLMRHPLYIGSTIIGAGGAVASASMAAAGVIALYLATTIVSAMRNEEAAMRASFGEQYDAYVHSRTAPVDRAFSISRAIKNKEHHAVAGLVAVVLILAAKLVFASR